MFDKLLKTYRPVAFQGDLDRRRYFEGWYFKLVDRAEGRRLAVIPGVSLDAEASASHAFVQTIDGNTAATSYFEYGLDAFEASSKRLEVTIGGNRFTSRSLHLDLESETRSLSGDVELVDPVPWPRRLTAPGVMGWYSFVPFMECYHGVVSLSHDLRGALRIDGERVDFGGGRGYAEKDWGTSFPSAYVWMQTNHFDDPRTSFMASIARIPWLGRSFTGYLAALWRGGELLSFTTYTGAELVDLQIDGRAVAFVMRDRRHELRVDARREASAAGGDDDVGLLRSPTDGSMKGRIGETLTATVSLRLSTRGRRGRPGRVLFEDEGSSAGLEIEGTAEELR